MAISLSSRYRNSALLIDEGNLRVGQVTTFPSDYTPVRFRNRSDNNLYVSRVGDTLDHLATAFLLDPELFWVIADYQPVPILSPLEPIEPGRTIVIPSIGFVRSEILRT